MTRYQAQKGRSDWFTPREPDRTVRHWGPMLERSGRVRVLDIGCGGGRHAVYLARLGLQVTAGDRSLLALEETGRWLERERLRAQLAQLDMATLPFARETFDAVLSVNVLHHARPGEARAAVEEVWRVLRPGGFFLAVLAGSHECRCLLERPQGARRGVCMCGAARGAEGRPCSEQDLYGLFAGFSILGTQRRSLSLPAGMGPPCWRGVNWRVWAERPAL